MSEIDQFFWFAREREEIRRSRSAGKAPPWTADPVLQQYRFCNVFREDDATTVWFRENVREPLRGDPKVFESTVAFRWFNLIETGKKILPWLVNHDWDRNSVLHVLDAEQRKLGRPVFTGAYIVKSPNGKPKLEGILDCIENVLFARHQFVSAMAHNTKEETIMGLKDCHAALMDFPYLGPFMAYEIVTDLRHTYLLDEADDICTWASAGPGACRGLQWIYGSRVSYGSHKGQEDALEKMRILLQYSFDSAYWPAVWPIWEMREVEHTLCEYSKWKEGHAGKRLKRTFQC